MLGKVGYAEWAVRRRSYSQEGVKVNGNGR